MNICKDLAPNDVYRNSRCTNVIKKKEEERMITKNETKDTSLSNFADKMPQSTAKGGINKFSDPAFATTCDSFIDALKLVIIWQ